MQLVEQHAEGTALVHGVSSAGLRIGDRVYRGSVTIAPRGVVEDLAFEDFADLDSQAIDQFAAGGVAVLIVGTGATQRFAPPKLVAELGARGIGLESMDSAAAARTYNVLAGEGRAVIAVFFGPPGDAQ